MKTGHKFKHKIINQAAKNRLKWQIKETIVNVNHYLMGKTWDEGAGGGGGMVVAVATVMSESRSIFLTASSYTTTGLEREIGSKKQMCKKKENSRKYTQEEVEEM